MCFLLNFSAFNFQVLAFINVILHEHRGLIDASLNAQIYSM